MNDSLNIKETPSLSEHRLATICRINLQLSAMGLPMYRTTDDQQYIDIAAELLNHYREQRRLLLDYRCPSDKRIQDFLNRYLQRHSLDANIALPEKCFILDKAGMANELSLPPESNHFKSPYVDSYRVMNGVLHNPINDRRTTKGVFHIVDGGLHIPADKRSVPVGTFAKLLNAALDPPQELLQIPFIQNQSRHAGSWVSLYLRPIVSPEVPEYMPRLSLETRFFAPAGLVSNLDFVERIFGNAGNPYLPENDAALDVKHWTGHSSCIILAPHLINLRKKDLGLPHESKASERQIRDGMCWKDEDEKYNDGVPFKLVCLNMEGVIVSIIADNYFGYSKKEVKSHISYSANLFGLCEEEHSGGALAFPSYNLGEYFYLRQKNKIDGQTFADTKHVLAGSAEFKDQGYGVDKQYSNIFYIDENSHIDLRNLVITWPNNGVRESLKLLPQMTYIYPSGYKVRIEEHPGAPSWRLIGTEAEGTFCHKPCTVSGGGKSEISKSIVGTYVFGSLYVGDIKKDLNTIEKIFSHNYSDRFRDNDPTVNDQRSLLSPNRSLGSVIRLLTPSETEYTDEYNEWLLSIPQHIRALVFIIKRFYKQSWGNRWRDHFTVDVVNGYPGNELLHNHRKLVASYLRVGLQPDASWRIFKMRQDFVGADKVPMEDDITAAITVSSERLEYLNPEYNHPCVKILENCEAHLFQRPDDAIHRGLDKQTELDLSETDNFISNFAPLTTKDAQSMVEDVIGFKEFSKPMQKLILRAAKQDADQLFVSSAHPRLVNGKPTPNVRYLQKWQDNVSPINKYIAERALRLHRKIPLNKPVLFPVNAVLTGRRNNPPDYKNHIRPLSVYNPIHYQELPELFMDFICSVTGKSPSTTGAGSEGALTKGPFNALCATADLNNALVAYILSGYDVFSSAAGFIGVDRRIDHDVSLLIPEIWCRISVHERDPKFMIEQGYLEKLSDFEHNDKKVLASRLGYRITDRFVHAYFGKIFDTPTTVFDEAMLKPETQDIDVFVDGVNNVVEAQQFVAQSFISNGSIDDACPPLQALITIMATGEYQGLGIEDPAFRRMFSREYLLSSNWYQQRIKIKQNRDIDLWTKHVKYLDNALRENNRSESSHSDLSQKLDYSKSHLTHVRSNEYLESLKGTIGADWIEKRFSQL